MLSASLHPFPQTLSEPVGSICTVSWLAVLSFLNIFYTYEHYLKITRYIVRRVGMENPFVQALVLCFMNSVPKTILLANLHRPSSVEEFSSAISGSTQMSIAVTLAVALISSKTNCFVHHTSFYKDILFLEASHLLLFLLFSNSPNIMAVPLMALGIFSIFLFNTILLPTYIVPALTGDVPSISPATTNPKMGILLRPVRFVLGIILLDPSSLASSESPKRTPYTIVLSPILNLLVLVTHFNMELKSSETIVLVVCSLVLGSALYVLAKERVLPDALYLYAFLTSILFFSVVVRSLVALTPNISKITGLGTQFLSGTLLSLQASLTEIITCSSYSRGGSPTLATCSVLYTHVYNTLLLFPSLKLFSSKDIETYIYNIAKIPFVHFSYVFVLAEIKVVFVNYLLRHRKLTSDLGYTLLVIYLLFIIGFAMEGKPYLCK